MLFVMGANPNREAVFRFKEFEVRNACSAMKVGTDGVLLGAWCDVVGAKRALDVGCGTGLIALMLAQRSSDLDVEAIDIMNEAVEEARHNVERSPWSKRISVREVDFNVFVGLQVEEFDLIVSNPPFYKAQVKSPEFSRRMARHGEGLDYKALIKASSAGLLHPAGRLAMILPSEFDSDVIFVAEMAKMRVRRKVDVFTKSAALKPSRTLWELTLNASAPAELGQLHIGSDEYRHITAPFYL
ncbi:MAG: methyltransferase [Muribaculum sp.]|nr:methyltransferase [Muribaculum sp.]